MSDDLPRTWNDTSHWVSEGVEDLVETDDPAKSRRLKEAGYYLVGSKELWEELKTRKDEREAKKK